MSAERKQKAFNDFLILMKEDKGNNQEYYNNLESFKKNGIGKNFLNLISMANYLISKGHNNELFNPFKYPIQKLIKTYKIVKMNDLDDKNDLMFSQILAIGTAFGEKESTEYFFKQKKQLGDNL